MYCCHFFTFSHYSVHYFLSKIGLFLFRQKIIFDGTDKTKYPSKGVDFKVTVVYFSIWPCFVKILFGVCFHCPTTCPFACSSSDIADLLVYFNRIFLFPGGMCKEWETWVPKLCLEALLPGVRMLSKSWVLLRYICSFMYYTCLILIVLV